MSNPLISIITLTYNHEKFINDCIESVLRQTYSNWELIILDDGSSDRTYSECQKYTEKDSRISLATQKNKGLINIGKSYNYCLNKCQGDYIAILEGDDYWDEHKLEKSIHRLIQDKSILLYGRSYLYKMPDGIFDTIPKIEKYNENSLVNNPPGAFYDIYLLNSIIPTATVIIKRLALLKIGGFTQPNDMPVVDYATILKLIPYGSFSFLNEPLSFYRIHNTQATSDPSVDTGSSTKHALSFYRGLSDKERSKINITLRDLERVINKKEALKYFRYGRAHYLDGNNKEALKYFLKMMMEGDIKLLAIGIMCCIMLLLGMSIEDKVSKYGYARIG